MQQGSPLLELYLIENREHITKNCGQFEIKKINEIQSICPLFNSQSTNKEPTNKVQLNI